MTLKEQISWCKSQIKAGYHVEVLRSILKRLQASENKEPPHPFHQSAVHSWQLWLRHHGLSEKMTPKDGKALREVLYALEKVDKVDSPEKAYISFCAILTNWHRTGKFYENQKDLTTIKNNLNKIIGLIKNGADKKQSNRNQAEQLANAINQKQQNRT